MKTLTCSQLGGPCDEQIHGETKDELMANGMAHLESAHPEMAADVKATPKDDPKMVAWGEKFNQDWENAPEDSEEESEEAPAADSAE